MRTSSSDHGSSLATPTSSFPRGAKTAFPLDAILWSSVGFHAGEGPIPSDHRNPSATPSALTERGGPSGSAPHPSEWTRLEAAARSLVERLRSLDSQNRTLRETVRERERRIEALESEVRELNQLKRDLAKRLDNLIAQLDRLDQASSGDAVSHS